MHQTHPQSIFGTTSRTHTHIRPAPTVTMGKNCTIGRWVISVQEQLENTTTRPLVVPRSRQPTSSSPADRARTASPRSPKAACNPKTGSVHCRKTLRAFDIATRKTRTPCDRRLQRVSTPPARSPAEPTENQIKSLLHSVFRKKSHLEDHRRRQRIVHTDPILLRLDTRDILMSSDETTVHGTELRAHGHTVILVNRLQGRPNFSAIENLIINQPIIHHGQFHQPITSLSDTPQLFKYQWPHNWSAIIDLLFTPYLKKDPSILVSTHIVQ